MSTISISVSPPGGGSPTNITDSVVFAETTFEQSMNAEPGTFVVTVRDPGNDFGPGYFFTGMEILLTIDGTPMFGGYVTSVSMTSFAPAADTSDLGDYALRKWILRGSDYNIIFDRRVVRDDTNPPDSYLSTIGIPITTDGAMVAQIVEDFTDCDDFSTAGISSPAVMAGTGNDPIEQGQKLRDIFTGYSYLGGTIFYVNPLKVFIYVPIETVEKRWGFSDQPNHNPITVSPDEYQGATTGFREVEGTEDGSYIENDVLVWGGSEFAGPDGGTVFARAQDATSQSTYGRWQYAETHFGEAHFKLQDGVDIRADIILTGPPGASPGELAKGLRYTQWQFTFTWNGSDVPELSGTRDHLVAGDIVTIILNAFATTQLLPLRTLRISFPDALEDDGTHLVQFDGTFGLQQGDPFTLWRYLLDNAGRIALTTVTAVNNDSTTTVYGSYYQGVPTPVPDDTTTVFAIPFPYIPGTMTVYRDTGAGLVLIRTVIDFTESDPDAGEFEMTVAPATGDNLYCVALAQASAP